MRTPSIENQSILIASCSVDAPTWEPVAAKLQTRGFDVVTFEADKVALQSLPFEVSVGDNGFEILYDQRKLCLDGVAAAWFRRPSFITNPRVDGATQMSLDMERRALQAALWDSIPEEMWLNSPDQILRAERKLSQLRQAHQLGFAIPSTAITNDWDSIQNRLEQNVICKSSYSVFYDGGEYRLLYTTPFTNDPSELPLDLNPYPGIWQNALKKSREWRITVVGDETFDAAIYTHEDAKDDWRKHQLVPGYVDFKVEPFPTDLKEKCFAYLGRFGLRFGAFDFIEDAEGQMTFLECNPNGQYMWLEHQLQLPISDAITSELIKIARRP
ncbi:MAG TPA: hypothetical protein VLF40_01055 [Candidatus Saccharimonadales bacterium]|nr:hypothetical protein [Candidatus Saccharimonadales bacterium]